MKMPPIQRNKALGQRFNSASSSGCSGSSMLQLCDRTHQTLQTVRDTKAELEFTYMDGICIFIDNACACIAASTPTTRWAQVTSQYSFRIHSVAQTA